MPHLLKATFQNILQKDTAVFNWFTEDANCGVWLCARKHPEDFWVSDSFWNVLGYSSDSYNTAHNTQKGSIEAVFGRILSREISQGQHDETIVFQDAGNEIISLSGHVLPFAFEGNEYLAIKFSREDNSHKAHLLQKIESLKKFNDIHQAANKVASVGGWEFDMENNSLIWSEITKEIHEVEPDYEPSVDSGLSFYKEGWSRNKIVDLFTQAIQHGTPFDAELKIITAKGRELWVRSFGKAEMVNGKCTRVYGAFQDIDEKKRSEQEYRLTKERFETIYNNSSIGIVLLNTSNHVLMANPASMKIFGFTQEDRDNIGNLSFKDFIHPDDLPLAIDKRQKLISGELQSYTIECRYFTKSGNIVWCRVNTSMVRGKENEDDLIITQVEDITLSKRLEDISSENSNRFISAFEYSPNGMALVGLDGKWMMVNETLSDMIGYSRDEFVSLSFQDMTHKDDLDTDIKLLRETLENKRKTYSIEKRYIHKNGSLVYGLLNVSLIRDAEGKPLYFISQINDITKRIEAEQELQESLNEHESLLRATTQVSIIQTDLDGVITKFNKGAENLLQYASEELVGKHSILKLHIDEELKARAQKLESKHGRSFNGIDVFTHRPKNGKFDASDWTYVRKDGSTFPVHMVITSVRDHKGTITGYLGIATDISSQKEMEYSLMHARDRAEAASRSKSEFLANMSHEIRTPLNGVIGFSDLLMKSELTESQRKYMQMVNTSAHSLLDIINDILDFSKIEAGKLELNIEKTDIIQLCAQTIDIVKHQAHAKSLEILLDIAPNISRFIYADPIRLRQILVNLMGNAVKFTLKGEIELKVRASGENKGIMEFSFAIRDTGIGIAPQNIQKIFTAFDQEDASTTRKYGGTGLGITISNKLLELMGSNLTVESEVNVGSTFSFTVNFATEENSTDISTTKVDIKNVLVVDDNANNLTILKDMLAVANIKSHLASNGIEALEILETNNHFDLAIVDYNMPYLNGIELVTQIRQTLNLDAGKLPVMLLHSSIDDEKLIQACIDLDIRFNVTKPILSDQLFDLLGNVHKNGLLSDDTASNAFEEGFNEQYEVLIAEDNPVNQMLAKTIIQKILPNANILLAENGLEAVAMHKDKRLDIIFMDIQMPEMSGFEATEKIRVVENGVDHIPIVAITARALVGEREECLKLGMDDYITKPINFDALQNIIKRYLVEPKLKGQQ